MTLTYALGNLSCPSVSTFRSSHSRFKVNPSSFSSGTLQVSTLGRDGEKGVLRCIVAAAAAIAMAQQLYQPLSIQQTLPSKLTNLFKRV